MTITALMTLAQLRERLAGIGVTNASDTRLQAIIDAVGLVAQNFCGATIPAARDEWHDGGTTSIALRMCPVLTVTTVKEVNRSGEISTLTEQVLDTATPTLFGWTLDYDSGVMIRRAGGREALFPYGQKNIHIIYTAGRATVDPDLLEGALDLAQYWWTQSAGGGSVPYGGGAFGDFADLPYRVQNRWRRFEQHSGPM